MSSCYVPSASLTLTTPFFGQSMSITWTYHILPWPPWSIGLIGASGSVTLLLWRLKRAEMVSTVFVHEMLTGKQSPFQFYSPSLTPTCVIGTVASIWMQRWPYMSADKLSWHDIGFRPVLDKTSKTVLMNIQLVVAFFVIFWPSLDNPPIAIIVEMKLDRLPIVLMPCKTL